MTTPDLKEIIRVLRDYAMPVTGERMGERHPTICGWTWDEIEKEVSSRPGVTVAEAEREACAAIAKQSICPICANPDEIAAAIRARGAMG